MRIDAALKRPRLIKDLLAAGLLAMIAALAPAALVRAGVAPAPTDDKQTADLKIYLATGDQPIGKSTYTVIRSGGAESIIGDNHYFDGQSDIERDVLARPAGDTAKMVSFDHVYFDASGKRIIEARLNIKTGAAECARFTGDSPQVLDKVLELPGDTYAGAGVLVPLADELARGVDTPVEMHVFQCAPGPRIFAINASLDRMEWPRFGTSNELIRARFVPMLGWYDMVLKPFVPKTDFWLDPKLDIIGGTISRYYHGPEITMVRNPAESGEITAADPPGAAPSHAPDVATQSAAAASPKPADP